MGVFNDYPANSKRSLAGTPKTKTVTTPLSGPNLLNEELEPRLLLSGTTYIVDSLLPDISVDGVITLPEAIQAANSNTAAGNAPAGSADETDVITFADSLFDNGPVTLNGDLFDINLNNLQIIGPGSDLLILEAQDDDRGISASGQSSLSGITLTGYEQAAFLRNVQVTLSDVHFVNCNQGLWIVHSDITMDNCLITGCTELVNENYSGAIYATVSNLTLNSSIISDNHFENHEDTQYGGGINFQGDSENTLLITDTVISNNSADQGGGIYTDSGLTMTGGELSGNTSTGNGGGVYLDNRYDSYFDSVLITNNVATVNGGAIYGSTKYCNLYIHNCDVVANQANIGGAVSRYSENDSYGYNSQYIYEVTVSSSRFYANYANQHGGVFYGVDLIINNSALVGNEAGVCGGVFAATDYLRSVSNTIVANSAGLGGGVFSCDAEIQNCIIAMNTANGILNDIDLSEFLTYNDFDLSGDYNIIGTIDITPVDGRHNMGGTVDQPLDPMFTANPDPGESGWTNSLGTPWIDETYDNYYGDLTPAEGSPAIATAFRYIKSTSHSFTRIEDQIMLYAIDAGGNPRWLGAGIDIGAFEYPGESERPIAEIFVNGHATESYFYISPLLEADDISRFTFTVRNTGEMYMCYDMTRMGEYISPSLLPTPPQEGYTRELSYRVLPDDEGPYTFEIYTNDFDNPKTVLTPVAAPIGDADLSGDVSLDDFILLKQNYGQTITDENGWMAGDFNGDLQINLDDFILLKQNYGTSATPATPATPAASQTASAAPGELALLVSTDGDSDQQPTAAAPKLNITDLTWSPPVKQIATDSNFDCLAAALIAQSAN